MNQLQHHHTRMGGEDERADSDGSDADSDGSDSGGSTSSDEDFLDEEERGLWVEVWGGQRNLQHRQHLLCRRRICLRSG